MNCCLVYQELPRITSFRSLSVALLGVAFKDACRNAAALAWGGISERDVIVDSLGRDRARIRTLREV